MPRLIKRRRDGRIELRLGDAERDVLDHVLGQLRDALVADPDDPVLRRLFPPAYVDDPEKEAGFRALARDELLEARLAALDEVEAVARRATDADAERGRVWMRSLNALRLVLGTRLDVTEDDDRGIDPDDPDAPALGALLLPLRPRRRARRRPRRRPLGTPYGSYRPLRPPSSSGLGHRPFKPATRVRIPLGVRSCLAGRIGWGDGRANDHEPTHPRGRAPRRRPSRGRAGTGERR